MKSFTLVPAYGRKYATEEAMLKDWKDGLDFKILGGPYCSIRDLDYMKKERVDSLVFVWGPKLENTFVLGLSYK
jgi:hypothetical protein